MNGRTFSFAVALVAAAAACGDATDQEIGQEPGAEAPAEMPQPEVEPGMAMLGVDSLNGAAYITDSTGRALYMLEGEPADSSMCLDACAEEWPPYTAAEGAPAPGDPLRVELIGTLQRPDGQTQLTYGGHPLYYYHDDTGPGQTAGQGATDRWGEWYLVTPAGEPLEQDAGGAGADTMGDDTTGSRDQTR